MDKILSLMTNIDMENPPNLEEMGNLTIKHFFNTSDNMEDVRRKLIASFFNHFTVSSFAIWLKVWGNVPLETLSKEYVPLETKQQRPDDISPFESNALVLKVDEKSIGSADELKSIGSADELKSIGSADEVNPWEVDPKEFIIKIDSILELMENDDELEDYVLVMETLREKIRGFLPLIFCMFPRGMFFLQTIILYFIERSISTPKVGVSQEMAPEGELYKKFAYVQDFFDTSGAEFGTWIFSGAIPVRVEWNEEMKSSKSEFENFQDYILGQMVIIERQKEDLRKEDASCPIL